MKSDGFGLVCYKKKYGLRIQQLLEVCRMKPYRCDQVKFPLNNMAEAVQIYPVISIRVQTYVNR